MCCAETYYIFKASMSKMRRQAVKPLEPSETEHRVVVLERTLAVTVGSDHTVHDLMHGILVSHQFAQV